MCKLILTENFCRAAFILNELKKFFAFIYASRKFKRKQTSFVILFLFVLLTQSFQISSVLAPDTEMDILLEGDITFKVYPDGDLMMVTSGSLTQEHEGYDVNAAIRGMSLAYDIEVIEDNLYEQTGRFVLEMGPLYAIFLSGLELDIDVHGENLNSDTIFRVAMPGMVEAAGSVVMNVDEETLEGSIEMKANATVWYSILPEIAIQGFMESFSEWKTQLETQIYEYTEHEIVLEELVLVEVERDELSATFAFNARVAGTFSSIESVFENVVPEYLDTEAESSIIPEDFEVPKIRSGDAHIHFDNENLAFNLDFEVISEGDPDVYYNHMKNLFLEEILEEPDLETDMIRFIEEFLLPTEVSLADLHMLFEISFESESSMANFEVEGIVLRPPTTGVFLDYLEETSNPSAETFTLTFKGESQGDKRIEIVVPEEVSSPLTIEPTKVVWSFDNLENLNKISFEVKEQPESKEDSEKPSPNIPTNILVPAVGAVVIAALGAAFFISRKS
jgi:hypothetical protein